MKTKLLITYLIVLSAFTIALRDNTLTKEERKEGWKLLYDGQSTNGWRTYQNKPSGSWSSIDGTLYCKPVSSKDEIRADLITDKVYENFELTADWKISEKGNSGILYMVNEEFKSSYLSGPEYQIIDDLKYPEKLEPWQTTASNYAMNPAVGAAIRPAGIWNHTRIIVNKGHVEHWLNHRKVVSYELYSEEWKKNKAAGKWKDAAGYAANPRGHIALQDHGSEAWFKNIKIKEL